MRFNPLKRSNSIKILRTCNKHFVLASSRFLFILHFRHILFLRSRRDRDRTSNACRGRLFSAVSRREVRSCRSSKITCLLMSRGGGTFSIYLSQSVSLFLSLSFFLPSALLTNETCCRIGAAVAKLTLSTRRDFSGRDFNAIRTSAFRVSGRHGIRGAPENRKARRDLSALYGFPGVHKRSGHFHVRVSIIGQKLPRSVYIVLLSFYKNRVQVLEIYNQ